MGKQLAAEQKVGADVHRKNEIELLGARALHSAAAAYPDVADETVDSSELLASALGQADDVRLLRGISCEGECGPAFDLAYPSRGLFRALDREIDARHRGAFASAEAADRLTVAERR